MEGNQDPETSWFRLAVTVVFDWRLILSMVLLLIIVLLMK